MDDADLVASALEESSQAFAEIYDRYVDRIYDYARSVLRSDADAADVTQDTFLAASQRLDQLRDPSRLRPWLYAIARSHSFRIIRERQRIQVSDDIDEVVEMNAPDDEIDARDLVWSAAAGLAATDRSILDLHLRQGLDGQELGDAMGVAANVANVALHRVRTRLEQSIGAVLLAKTSKKECSELDELMVDGLNPLARKRIVRHLDSCAICQDRRRAMTSPSVLFAATPLAAAPFLMREQILASIGTERAAQASSALDWKSDGFPNPDPIGGIAGLKGAAIRTTARTRMFALASTAAVVLLVVVGLFVTLRSDSSGAARNAEALPASSTSTSSQSAPALTTAVDPTEPASTATSLGTIRSEGTLSTAASSRATASPTTELQSSQAGAPVVSAAPAPPPVAAPTAGDATATATVADVPVVTDPVAIDPVVTAPPETAPPVTTPPVNDPVVTTTIPATVPPLPPSILLVNFVCAFTMEVTVDVNPSLSVTGTFEALGGQSTSLVAHSSIAGRFTGSLVIGEGSVTPRVVATGPGGTSSLILSDCIVID